MLAGSIKPETLIRDNRCHSEVMGATPVVMNSLLARLTPSDITVCFTCHVTLSVQNGPMVCSLFQEEVVIMKRYEESKNLSQKSS